MRVLGITLARAGSKGVKNKNIRSICGKPLIAYTIEEARKATMIDRHIVSTDSPEIADVVRKHGGEAPFLRPEDLAQDDTPSLPALLHALEWAEEDEGEEYDIVADLRCTNPLKTQFDIDGCIDKLIKTGADVVVGVTKLEDHHPARIKQIFQDRLIDFGWPEPLDGNRQLLKPDAYIRNGSIYIARKLALYEGIHIGGSDEIRPWVMPEERSINIDTEMDFLLAEALINERGRG